MIPLQSKLHNLPVAEGLLHFGGTSIVNKKQATSRKSAIISIIRKKL